MASRFLEPVDPKDYGRLYNLFERMFDRLLHSYERGLDTVLAHRFITLMVFLGAVALTGDLFLIIPKGFFPQQDTGLITGISQGAQDISVRDMMRVQEKLGAIALRDPTVAHMAMAIGGTDNPSNTGRMFITLKPRDQRDATADQVIARLQPQLASYEVILEVLLALQDDLNSLDKIFIKSSQGGEAPLAAVAKWTTNPVEPLNPVDRHRQKSGIMLVDFAMTAEREQNLSALDAISRRRCCASDRS
jgi:multidrug efflux pump subunit AcrB